MQCIWMRLVVYHLVVTGTIQVLITAAIYHVVSGVHSISAVLNLRVRDTGSGQVSYQVKIMKAKAVSPLNCRNPSLKHELVEM
mgnify:FL=1